MYIYIYIYIYICISPGGLTSGLGETKPCETELGSANEDSKPVPVFEKLRVPHGAFRRSDNLCSWYYLRMARCKDMLLISMSTRLLGISLQSLPCS